MQKSTVLRSVIVTSLALIVLSPLTMYFPTFRRVVFCLPVAWASAGFLGAQCVATIEGYLVDTDSLPVLVSLACSGSSFFVLLTAMLLGTVCRYRRLSIRAAGVVFLGAYGITLIANTCRVTLGFHVAVLSRRLVPECLWSGLHMSVGVLVFLSALVGAYMLSERSMSHE